MGEANEGRRKGTESFSLQTENYPRDLLHRFIFSNARKSEFMEVKEEEEEGSEGVELNLGLSLGGRFGVDKNSKKLIRSSSIAGTITIVRGDEALNPPAARFPALIRTSSLPTETEEEWRKRKELQSLRRMEAKRRRSEKQRSKEGVVAGAGRYSEEERPEIEGLEAVNYGEKKGIPLVVEENMAGLTVESQNRVAAAAKQALFGGIDIGKKGRSSLMVGLGDGHGDGEGAGRPISQGSMESQGGSLSGMSELENKPPTGSNSNGEARSSSSTPTLQEQGNGGEAGGSNKNENLSKTSKEVMKNMSCKQDSVNSRGRGRESRANSIEDMPCVFTVGDGPHGRRVEGILYKYGKGEEVRIMCVCHGTFLSPAEFVKHAGGGDVANPLRHIVVHPKSSSFL